MAIIIDTNCFGNVFSTKSPNHEQFKPVLHWILEGKGVIVYGGSTYIQELASAQKYQPIFRYLRNIGKAIEDDKTKIDKRESEVKKLIIDPDFDDQHLAAIVYVSKCKLICSLDTRSIKFLSDAKLYDSASDRPIFYTQLGNKKILCDKNVNPKFKPVTKLNKQGLAMIRKGLESI